MSERSNDVFTRNALLAAAQSAAGPGKPQRVDVARLKLYYSEIQTALEATGDRPVAEYFKHYSALLEATIDGMRRGEALANAIRVSEPGSTVQGVLRPDILPETPAEPLGAWQHEGEDLSKEMEARHVHLSTPGGLQRRLGPPSLSVTAEPQTLPQPSGNVVTQAVSTFLRRAAESELLSRFLAAVITRLSGSQTWDSVARLSWDSAPFVAPGSLADAELDAALGPWRRRSRESTPFGPPDGHRLRSYASRYVISAIARSGNISAVEVQEELRRRALL